MKTKYDALASNETSDEKETAPEYKKICKKNGTKNFLFCGFK